MSRNPLATALLGLALLFLAACGKAPVHHQESFVFGTRVEILVAGLDEARARPAAAAVLREFDRLHRTYHAWQPSELSDLNSALSEGKALTVSDEMAGLLSDAQRLSALGDGLFDPGIGKLIRLWGFHADDYKAVLPDPDQLAAWRNHPTGIADLTLDGKRIGSRSRQVAIDLGGYLKGYALDRAAAILREHGVANALVNIGGNVMALGSKNGTPWSVGIQHPRQPGPLATLQLRDGEAIGTSGDYQRYFELDGQRYAHLLDPRTGQPAHGTQSMTVLVTPGIGARNLDNEGTGTLSDAASKPAYLAGEGWREQTRRFGIEHALRIAEDGRVEVTRALRARLQFIGPVEPSVVD